MKNPSFTESVVEDAALAWMETLSVTAALTDQRSAVVNQELNVRTWGQVVLQRRQRHLERECMGVELPQDSKLFTSHEATSGAESGAPATHSQDIDPALAAVIEAWPTLPEAIRTGILAMVRASGK
ncbi:MAG: hypothetical protein U0840_08600 [Gemmataceae bacterium]